MPPYSNGYQLPKCVRYYWNSVKKIVSPNTITVTPLRAMDYCFKSSVTRLFAMITSGFPSQRASNGEKLPCYDVIIRNVIAHIFLSSIGCCINSNFSCLPHSSQPTLADHPDTGNCQLWLQKLLLGQLQHQHIPLWGWPHILWWWVYFQCLYSSNISRPSKHVGHFELLFGDRALLFPIISMAFVRVMVKFYNIFQTWWRHPMETFSALLALCARNCADHWWIPRTEASDTKLWFFRCAWTNGWVSDRDPGDLRRHRAHYDVTVIQIYPSLLIQHCSLCLCFSV